MGRGGKSRIAAFVVELLALVLSANAIAAAQNINNSRVYVRGLIGAVADSDESSKAAGAAIGAQTGWVSVDGEFTRTWGEAAYLSTVMGNVEMAVVQRPHADVYVAGALGAGWADYRLPLVGPRNWGIAWDAGGGVRIKGGPSWSVFVDVRELLVHGVFSSPDFFRVSGGVRYAFA